MDQAVTLSTLVEMGIIIIGFWGFVKVVKEIIESITARHDREQKWDEMEKTMKEDHKDILENVQEERDKIYRKYDEKLAEMEQAINTNHADTAAKFQQMGAEMLVLTECMAAVLDGLKQLNCNGKVSEAADNLARYMMERAHE